MTPLISLKGVSKTYPGVIAARNVDLDLHRGEVIGLVGKNGAGKSTIIRIIAGVETSDAGDIKVDGTPVHFSAASDATRVGIAVVHQELNDIPMLTVAENILLGLGYPQRFGIIQKREMRTKAQAALDAIHMPIDVNQRVSDLSVAERRMVMIARGLAANAKVVVLDEPTASLTETEIEELFAVIRRMQDAGVGIIYVSHRLQEVLHISNQVAVMRDGQLVKSKPTKDLTESDLVSLISGKSVTQHTPATPVKSAKGKVALKVDGLVPLPGRPPISVTVHRGEILGLAGLAGSGRTEILRQIMGADRTPDILHEVAGQRVSIKTPRDAWSHGIALVPEDRRTQGAILQFSIAQNVTLASLNRYRLFQRFSWPSARKENVVTQTLIDQLRIKATSAQMRIGTLSGGNQQKTILARCLAANSTVLLLDEPTHGVDVDAKEEIYRVIKTLAAEGAAIIVVSSELKELVGLVDRAMVLRDGIKIAMLTGADITEESVLTHCFAANTA